MNEVLKLLKNINFWTIIGSIIGLLTLYFTILQHKDNELSIVVLYPDHTSKALKDGDVVQCILMGYNNDDTRDKVYFRVPVAFKNDMKQGIKMSYQAISPNVKIMDSDNVVTDGGNSVEMVILQHDCQQISYELYPDVLTLDEDKADDVKVRLLWSYEKMSGKGSCTVTFKVSAVNDDLKGVKCDHLLLFAPSDRDQYLYVPYNPYLTF